MMNLDFNTSILYDDKNYPGFLNQDLDDDDEKEMIKTHHNAIDKLNNINNIEDDKNSKSSDSTCIENIDEYNDENSNVEDIDINKDDNIDDVDDVDDKNIYKTNYDLINFKNDSYNKHNKYDIINTYINSNNNNDLDPIIITNYESTNDIINIKKLSSNNDIKKRFSPTLITNRYDHITNEYDHINNNQKLNILENENKILKQKLYTIETKKMNDFYNLIINPDFNIVTIKNYILNYSREINNELSIVDLNSIDDEKIQILYKSIKELKKKSSQLELSTYIIKIILVLLESVSTNFLQTNILKDISKDVNINTDFNNTQEMLNNNLYIPDFPFKDVISHIIKKACINIGHKYGFEKILIADIN